MLRHQRNLSSNKGKSERPPILQDVVTASHHNMIIDELGIGAIRATLDQTAPG